MKIKVTEEHLDRALSVPWSTTTCILAQAAADAGLTNHPAKAGFDGTKKSMYAFAYTPVGYRLLELFDAAHGHKRKVENLTTIREMLPVELEVNDD